MLSKTTGIILHSIKYTDSASIVTVYTQQFGRVSYMVHGVNKKKSMCRAALLQPLSMVEMDVFHVPGKDIQRIKDLRMNYQFTGIPFNPVKNSLALFLSEVLFKSLRQTEPDENLYLFLENSIQQLDCCEEGIANFHLVFLIKMSRYLGFAPNTEDGGAKYFDLMNGVFSEQKALHMHYLLPETTIDFISLLETDYAGMHRLILTRERRSVLLKGLVEYYLLHIPEFHTLHSLAVLQSLFD
ncbi:DNA repair protein RecO [Paludibacter propionicigenes WB4]|uniref:DNA repair protein RecO n=1 Tax=Paludibacter propionicigenes (strain DSM 17365 / JCM 13257 / WB4) TaxID=694427 RepID=E4T6J3_PALPW|nr:DNA repair protein RecO [Paludibacter propionicigenes]ADQ80337.1 DNA repair protein RecO [Paludibacter propionicigenes WB4]